MEKKMHNEQLLVFNPHILPIGLLSSKHFAEFDVTNIVKTFGFNSNITNRLSQQKWQTVSQFTYVNMFSDTETRQLMGMSLTSPFSSMIELHGKHDIVLFRKEVKYGLEKKFEQNPQLFKFLQTTKNSKLKYGDNTISTILEELRAHKNYIFDPLTNKNIPKTEVAGVLFELEKAFSSTDPPLLDDYLPYEQVVRLFPPRLLYRQLDIKINDVNSIVKIAKLKTENSLIVKNIEKFKTHLLNVFLDYILEKEYIYVPSDLYETAKTQQLNKEPINKIALLKNQLYQLYLKGPYDCVYEEVFTRITNIPEKFTLNEDILDEETPYSSKLLEFEIPENSPLLPQYEESIVIDGITFRSILHYAYLKLIENLLNIFPMQGFKSFDINSIPVLDLVNVYTDIKTQWIEHALKIFNEIAISAKLETYLSLKHFLVQTKGLQLIWNDVNDPILGIGDGCGQNLTGNFLMFKRDEINASKLENGINVNLMTNLMTNLYMYSMALEYRSSLLLLEKPNIHDLETIYGKTINSVVRQPTNIELEIFKKAGLTIPQTNAAAPFIINYYQNNLHLTMDKQAKKLLNIYFNETLKPIKLYSFDVCQYNDNLKEAKDFLLHIINTVHLAPGVTKEIFVNSILCGKHLQENVVCKPLWPRVYKWSHLHFMDEAGAQMVCKQYNKSDKEKIKTHYNEIKDKGKQERTKSKAINIKNVNNFIKTLLIQQYSKKGGSVLDLGCGKGEDLLKYGKVGIKEYYGVDIADIFIEDAKIRHKNSKLPFTASFIVQDAYCDFLTLNKEFDLVSSQFSLHYAFFNDKCAKTAIDNISRHLKPGGFFIATIPNKDVILDRIKKGNTSNEFYKIETENVEVSKLKNYQFSLVDSVNDCVEYFIDVDKMVNEFNKYSVMLIERLGFITFYNTFKEQNKNPSIVLTKEELDVIDLYDIVVFRKQN